MFAALHAPSSPGAGFLAVAQAFTPRFQVWNRVIVLDVGGLSRLFGGPEEIGDYLYRTAVEAAPDVRVAITPTATASMLLALSQAAGPILTASDVPAALAPLPLSVLADYEQTRVQPSPTRVEPTLASTTDARATAGDAVRRGPDDTPPSGWNHPRDTHQAQHMRRRQRAIASVRRVEEELAEIEAMLQLLRRWGLTTLGRFAALPVDQVAERLGARGTRWQHLARGEDDRPLVPWVPEEPFEASIDLEWPIEGLEPLSFVLTRLLEPLSERLELADRGAAVVHTRLRLTDKSLHLRHLPLPAPMRDAKTLRTLMLLDLESHPPSAAVDRVGVLVEPVPGRVLQWTLFERAQPSPEQVSTLLARLTALMGEGHVGAPATVDSWRPGAFRLAPFAIAGTPAPPLPDPASTPSREILPTVMRRFRLPVPARVRVEEGRPVRVQVDRRGMASGAVVQAAGPWRTSGEWWQIGDGRPAAAGTAAPGTAAPRGTSEGWDRDEWDVALNDGTVYRVFVERPVGQWFIEGVID